MAQFNYHDRANRERSSSLTLFRYYLIFQANRIHEQEIILKIHYIGLLMTRAILRNSVQGLGISYILSSANTLGIWRDIWGDQFICCIGFYNTFEKIMMLCVVR